MLRAKKHGIPSRNEDSSSTLLSVPSNEAFLSHKKKAPAATLRSRGIQFDWGQFGVDENESRRSPRSTT